jgi:CDP-diacylglycerol--glycerol-3-phosphate 3-phosphatidyltransferase
MGLANWLTVLRILLIPVFVALLVYRKPGAALTVFTLAALTDLADGYVARRHGGGSRLGAFLDPMADKILVVGTLIALAISGVGWPVTVVAILVAIREATVTVARLRLYARGIGLPADMIAKAKTVLEMAGVALIILDGRPWAVAGTGIVGVAFLIGLWTLPRYFTPRLA